MEHAGKLVPEHPIALARPRLWLRVTPGAADQKGSRGSRSELGHPDHLHHYEGNDTIKNMKLGMDMAMQVIRKTLRVRDIPASWAVPGNPDAPVTVVITPGAAPDVRPLSSFIGAGRGVFASAREVNRHIRRERDAWEA